MKLTRKQALEILTTDEVYQAMSLDKFYSDENEACPSIYDVLGALGVDHKEIGEVLGREV
mgnify:CR=1 FL=1